MLIMSLSMEITYFGHSCFRIKGKNVALVTDPFSEGMIGLKLPKIAGDIVTISHHHGDHDYIEGVSDVRKVIDGPGEYEVSGVSIIGVSSFHDNSKGSERGKNTIYVIEIDGFRLAHLGDLGHKLDENQIKQMGNIDILLIPVGGTYTIDAKTAVEVYKQIGPSIIVPMHFKPENASNEILNNLTPVDDFLKESALRIERLPKLVVKEGTKFGEEEYAVVLEKK